MKSNLKKTVLIATLACGAITGNAFVGKPVQTI